jgi:hypothetical protein
MSFGIGRRGEATGAEYHDDFGTSCTGAIDLRFPAEGAELSRHPRGPLLIEEQDIREALAYAAGTLAPLPSGAAR